MMEQLLVRPNEVAELLGLGRSKVYALIASGELPSVKIGKSIRVPVEELRQWVHGRVSAPGVSNSHDEHTVGRGPRQRGETAILEPAAGEKIRLLAAPASRFATFRGVWRRSKFIMRIAE
jgi:excisionase family DNA binding protein